MVQWAAAAEVAKEAGTSFNRFFEFRPDTLPGIFTKLIFCLFGIYVWEIFQTSDFEWCLITRKRKFTWPLVCVIFLNLSHIR